MFSPFFIKLNIASPLTVTLGRGLRQYPVGGAYLVSSIHLKLVATCHKKRKKQKRQPLPLRSTLEAGPFFLAALALITQIRANDCQHDHRGRVAGVE